MTEVPSDLVPLPTMPYSERPASLPLDVEECRTALWRVKGNIADAAELLKVSSSRLRKFVQNSAFLTAECAEATERLKDRAMAVVADALEDAEDKARQDQMARFLLTNLGRDRGFGQAAKQGGVNLKLPQGNFTITWGDGTPVNDNGDEGDVIEGEFTNSDTGLAGE